MCQCRKCQLSANVNRILHSFIVYIFCLRMDVSKKLEEYRKHKLKYIKEKPDVIITTDDKDIIEKLLPETNSIRSMQPEFLEDPIDDSLNCLTLTDMLYYGLCFILWSILYVGIYINTRTTPKRRGEVSAYSVFNKDCKSIDGTLKAEQFEREIRYGPSVLQ
ncbi:unnamed protein product [Psylliodes chrysocephalus]|uniref:SAYSvFN domain-containing protein n=1 Tax=Psylliodes chrysocephalus TaxID=3402493 RepID=A0A9P0GEQ5_9CUCU|nr:unnamed protein product [Psylliodes chrysocephala]